MNIQINEHTNTTYNTCLHQKKYGILQFVRNADKIQASLLEKLTPDEYLQCT